MRHFISLVLVTLFLSACATKSSQYEKREPAQSQVGEFGTSVPNNSSREASGLSEHYKQITSLSCDRDRVASFVKEKIANYRQAMNNGKISADDGKDGIAGINDLVEMNGIRCGWIAPKTASQKNPCEQYRLDAEKAKKLFSQGLIDKDDFDDLMNGKQTMLRAKNINCD